MKEKVMRPATLRRGTAIAAGIIAALVLWQASSPAPDRGSVMHSDSESYESVESLAEAADIIALGEFEGQREYVDDNGGDPANNEFAAKMSLQDFHVSEYLGPRTAGSTITIVNHDLRDFTRSDGVSEFEVGDRSVLFLLERTHETAPGVLDPGEIAYVAVSNDNGVFDVGEDGTTSPRSPHVKALRERSGSRNDSEPWSTTVSEIRDIVN